MNIYNAVNRPGPESMFVAIDLMPPNQPEDQG